MLPAAIMQCDDEWSHLLGTGIDDSSASGDISAHQVKDCKEWDAEWGALEEDDYREVLNLSQETKKAENII